MTIGRKIKNIRLDNKLTQKEFADKINKSCITIRKYESGDINPPMDVLYEICNIFNVPMNYFFSNTQNQYVNSSANDYNLKSSFCYSDVSMLNENQTSNTTSILNTTDIENISYIISNLGYSIKLSENEFSNFVVLNDHSNNISYKLTMSEFNDFYERIIWNIKNEIDFIKFKKNR